MFDFFLFLWYMYIWAMSWENLFMLYANKGADQPAHPCSLISTFIVRYLDSIISLVSISEISILELALVAVQAGLSLTWSKTAKSGFLVMRFIYCRSTHFIHYWDFYFLMSYYMYLNTELRLLMILSLLLYFYMGAKLHSSCFNPFWPYKHYFHMKL